MLTALLLLGAGAGQAQWNTQTLVLTQGWNAVFLNVAPAPADCDTVFGQATRIVSVRRWAPISADDVTYDEATGTIVPNSGSWLTWFPTNSPNRFLLNMSEAPGGAAYLIELSAGAPVSLLLKGHPLAVRNTWIPGSHHFVGLPVATNSPVSFSAFFAAATNAIPVDYRQGGEVYRVKSDGSSERIFLPATTYVESGRAYWIKAVAASEFSGPIGVNVESPGGWMDFGRRLIPQYVELRNETAAARTVTLSQLASQSPPAGAEPLAGAVPLKFAVVSPQEGVLGRTYAAFPGTWTTQLTAGASVRLALMPDATLLVSPLTNAAYQSVMQVADGGAQVLQRFGLRVGTRSGAVQGLWVGEATISDVGRLEMLGVIGTIPAAPVPVHRPFKFRLICHVDSNGTARLLQRALVGTSYDAQASRVQTEILADESEVAAYKGAHPDGKVFRVASANFPFFDPLVMSGGSFGAPNQTLYATVMVDREDGVNPFRHQYAPLHDNLEQRAENRVPYADDVEVFSVRRDVELLFQPPDESSPDPRWGDTVCGGIYREDIAGLGGPMEATNRVIKVQGTFRLERALDVGGLTGTGMSKWEQ